MPCPSLGSSGGLHLSSSGDDPCCTEQDQELCGGGDHPDRLVLANERVVPRSVVPGVGASDPPSVAVGSVRQPHVRKFHQRLSILRLHAWKNSSDTLELQGSLLEWLNLADPEDHPC